MPDFLIIALISGILGISLHVFLDAFESFAIKDRKTWALKSRVELRWFIYFAISCTVIMCTILISSGRWPLEKARELFIVPSEPTPEREFVRIVIFGSIGVTIEVIWNGIRKNLLFPPRTWNAVGEVSLWMFLVYGFGLTKGFDILYLVIEDWPWHIRWLSFPVWIWAIEILVGIPTRRKIWDYSEAKYNLWGVVRFDYAPLWIIFGIAVEKLRLIIDPLLFTR